MILGLALIPSKSFQEEVNAYRKRYDTHYAQIMPHITVKSQFEVNDADLDSVKKKLKLELKVSHQSISMLLKHQVSNQ